MLQIGLERPGEPHVIVEHEDAPVLAPGTPCEGDPVLRRELGEPCGEELAQDLSTLREVARNGKLSHIALDLQQSPWLDDRTNVVEDYTGHGGRPRSRQHHGENAAVRGAHEYGWRDVQRR